MHVTTTTERNHLSPEMYFLAIMDCHDEIHKTVGDKPAGKMVLDSDMTDDNNNEFSYEDLGILEVDTVLFLVYFALFILYICDYRKQKSNFGSLHHPHMYCLAGMWLQLWGIFFSLVHNYWYKQDGEGVPILDVFSTTSDMFSECTMSILIMMLANGWYTYWTEYSESDFNEYAL